MKCIRCAKTLETREYEGVEIDRCPGCHGTWLDDTELAEIVRTEEETFSSELVRTTLSTARPGVPDGERKALISCPKCRETMKAVNYAYSSGIIVNACPAGHGVWLDGDELEQAQSFEEHCRTELQKHRADWTAVARAAGDDEVQRELRARKEGPVKYLVNSVIRRLMDLMGGQ